MAALAAALAADGRRTLVVAEQRVALDRVLQRLSAIGLDGAVLDLRDGAGARRRVARALAASIEAVRQVPRPAADDALEQAGAAPRRARRARALAARPSRAVGVSAFDAQVALADLTGRRPAPRSRVRVRGKRLQALGRDEPRGADRPAARGRRAWAPSGSAPTTTRGSAPGWSTTPRCSAR
ncbi:hypothetical protein GCM10025868_15820 [Angustibacter aerolatus]|uniref:Helicase ATP-binding domain-containing protein n=1 Tax=Angustibacter aerolatus TaxID=1162965 RepID=A0ABQ6JEW5_9ACTN|nr:hypothetical protein GCM10025868_15820 [Angustibacter aerolatus]